MIDLNALITAKGAHTLIEIDGGVTNANARRLTEAGADVLVAAAMSLSLKILKPL